MGRMATGGWARTGMPGKASLAVSVRLWCHRHQRPQTRSSDEAGPDQGWIIRFFSNPDSALDLRGQIFSLLGTSVPHCSALGMAVGAGLLLERWDRSRGNGEAVLVKCGLAGLKSCAD